MFETSRKMIIKEYLKEKGREDLIEEIINPAELIDIHFQKTYWKCSTCSGYVHMTVSERLNNKKIICDKCKKIRNLKREGTKYEFGDLCKSLHTSLPEQYIFIYLKKKFHNVERSKRFKWLNPFEIDIYIPELKLGIEYDGIQFHKGKKDIDEEKNILIKKHRIEIFRIREKGLPIIDNANCFEYDHEYDYNDIYKPINALIDFINEKYKKRYKSIKNNNIDNLKELALENLRQEKRDRSILSCWPEIERYWDYEANGKLRPIDFLPSSKILAYAKCPYCGMKVRFLPCLAYYRYGLYSFNPHICKEQFKYCLKILKKKFNNQKIELTNRIDDRRLKDWLSSGVVCSDKRKIEECKKIGFILSENYMIKKYNIATQEDFKKYRKIL